MSDWRNILGDLAPTIASAIGGPYAGMATKFIASKLLGNESATVDDIEHHIINAKPEDLTKLKELENNFKLELKRLDIERDRLAVDNTKDARAMASRTTLKPQIALSALFVCGYFSILLVIASGVFKIPPEMKDTLILLLGVMTREMPTIMQFWFGSSFGSKRKSEQQK